MYGSRKTKRRVQPHLCSTVRAQFIRGSRVLSPLVPQHLEFRKGVCTFTSASGLLLPTRSSLRSILATASLNRLKQDLKVRFLLYTDALTHTHNITHTSVYLSELSMDIETQCQPSLPKGI